ncbi:hypothetical protein E2C01_060132 [Portunus trituberculatus]|uniref:Uncharacterized protein n=1 Tax=Portunus trituberculatus TaxID=210409 RepID=A0A5B7H814_PORTR|nr:hypothetical protein [Portunus trituberculatus]
MKLHFLGVSWCVGMAAGWLALAPLHKGVEDMVGPATPANDSAFLDGKATTDPPSPTDGTTIAPVPSSPPSDVPTPNPVPYTNPHQLDIITSFPTPALAPHTSKTPNHNRGSVNAPATLSSAISAAQNTAQDSMQDSSNNQNSTNLTNETQEETTTDAATVPTPTNTRKLWRGMKCESMQWKDGPDCVVAVPSQVFYPWDVFRTTYEVIMAELTTRYTALPLNTPELDGVRVYCRGMEELKLALRWCYLLVPSAQAIVPMPQASVSFHLDKGRYTFAEKWMYKAVEVRCPSTPPFWIRRSDPIRCASVSHTCLYDTYDYLDELDKTTIPEAINVPPSW